MNDLPVFIVSVVRSDPPQLEGAVNRWHWVGEGHIAYLCLDADRLVEGKFRNVNETDKSVSFAFKQPSSIPEIRPGKSIPYLDGYWGERAAIACDRTLDWREMTFRASSALHHDVDTAAEGNQGVWPHEHCAICWATISQKENQAFMKSSQDDCVCLDCFRNHVEPRNLDFIDQG